MINNDTATITLSNPTHGTFEVDPSTLSRAIEQVGLASIYYLRQEAAGACGHTPNWLGTHDAFDDLTRIEVLIAWIESGNHPF